MNEYMWFGTQRSGSLEQNFMQTGILCWAAVGQGKAACIDCIVSMAFLWHSFYGILWHSFYAITGN